MHGAGNTFHARFLILDVLVQLLLRKVKVVGVLLLHFPAGKVVLLPVLWDAIEFF